MGTQGSGHRVGQVKEGWDTSTVGRDQEDGLGVLTVSDPPRTPGRRDVRDPGSRVPSGNDRDLSAGTPDDSEPVGETGPDRGRGRRSFRESLTYVGDLCTGWSQTTSSGVPV